MQRTTHNATSILLVKTNVAMQTDADLPTLIKRRDNLNVLRYIRVHQLREPELVVKHGKALFGDQLEKTSSTDESSRLAALEQICLGSLDCNDTKTAELCLARLSASGVGKESTRFRRLLARCLEGSGDWKGAGLMYDELLKENPSNLQALKRKYCVLKSQVGMEIQAVEALNQYLQQARSDTGAWYEMAQLRLELGDYTGASFALEEVVLGCPSEAKIHLELAECYSTAAANTGGGNNNSLEQLELARKHMAQALELEPQNRRAQFGLVTVANAYIEEATTSKKAADEYETQVAGELVKYGAEQALQSYKGTAMFAAVQNLMKEYTSDLK